MQFENKVLSKEILFLLYESGKTLATAESCTSGKVAESITLMPGASAYFTGGIVAYSEEVKKSLLNVPEELIEEKTVVSEGTQYRLCHCNNRRCRSWWRNTRASCRNNMDCRR